MGFRLGSSSKMVHLAEYLGLKKSEIASADLVAGYTCPGASLCKSYANPRTGKVTDAKGSQFRCYATSLEAVFPSNRRLHWANFDAMRAAGTVSNMVDEISASLSNKLKVVRIHSSGDFFNANYFEAWLNVCSNFPAISFFGYTKILPYLKVNKPDNLHLVYSFGGIYDKQLTKDIPTAYVLNDLSDAISLNIPVACQNHPADDYDYIVKGDSFGLLLHGVQPAKKVKNV